MNGCHFAIYCYVRIDGCGLKVPGLDKDIVPIIPVILYIVAPIELNIIFQEHNFC
jgi:hypothetical protein